MKLPCSLQSVFKRWMYCVMVGLCGLSAEAQITEVHTQSGGNNLRSVAQVRRSPTSVNVNDADNAAPAFDFTDYDVTVHSEADHEGLRARGSASAKATLVHGATNLSFTASGDTSSTLTLTGGESDPISGAGGVSALDLSFTLTERCSYSFSATSFVSTNGRTESSETEVQFQGGNDNEIDISVIAGDTPGLSLVASGSRSGFLLPGTYFLSGFTNTSLGGTQPSAVSSFTMSLTVSAAPENNPDVQEIVWRTPTSGSFADDGNWFPEKVPDANDSAIFNKPGNYTVDVGLQHNNRIEVSRGKVTLANALYLVDALSQELTSVRVNANGQLTLDEGGMVARHVILGDNGVPGAHGSGLLVVRGDTIGLEASGRMRVGADGKGLLLVDEGGRLTSASSSIGSFQSGSIATVGGDNTKWTTGNMELTGSLPKLNIARGAKVESGEVVANATTALFGGTITVSGATADGTTSSLWDVQQRLTLNNGTLNVEQHGHVLANSVQLADKKSQFAEIFVKGNKAIGVSAPRAQLDVATSLVVGGLGRGRVTISEGAVVTTQNNVLISGVPGVPGSDPGNGEVFVVPAADISAPRSTLQIEGKLQMSFGDGGNGLLRLTDGTLLNCSAADIGLGANSFSGIELVHTSLAASQPEMNVTNDLVLGFGLGSAAIIAMTDAELNVGGNLTINSNCSIQGTGVVNVGGTLDLNGNGFISPGLSPGILTINGNVTVGADAFIDAEAAGPEVGAEADQLVINGNLTMNGALNLRFINGYAPRQGESVSVLKVSGTTTGVIGVNVIGLASGAQFDVGLTNGTLTATALNDTVSLAVVSIPIAPKKISEKAARGGAVIFKRKGDVSAPLTVGYSVIGTADNGIDHRLLTGEITFPAKKKTVKLTVKPLDDLELEGNETISIKVQPGDDYTVALKSKANLTLVDNEKRKKK
jgi:hypothetical protein